MSKRKIEMTLIATDRKGWCAVTVEADQALLDESGEPRVFGSRLAAHQYFQAHPELLHDSQDESLESQGWRIVRARDVKLTPHPVDTPMELLVATPLEAAKMLYEYHYEYVKRAESWLGRACSGVSIPEQPVPKATILTPDWAGLYSTADHSCCYPLTYVMLNGQPSAQETAAHEVTHAYQRAFTGTNMLGHGPDFYGLMKHAMQMPISRHTHSYDVGKARQLTKQIKPWWDRELQRGTLNNLPMEIAVVKMKRKGIR
jgi:hypothetical protein